MTYSTKDLHFAAFLFVKGIKLVEVTKEKIESSNKIRAYFVFENHLQCKALEELYWNDEKQAVPIKAYISAIRELRDRTGTMS